MYNVPVEYCVALFASQDGAESAYRSFKAAQEEKEQADILNVALLRKDVEGKFHIKEPSDMGGGKGAAIGGVIGALLGVITGPGAIITGAAGAAIGGLAARLHDTGFDNQDLRALAESLQPDTSALLAVVQDYFVKDFSTSMTAAGAQVIQDAVDPDLAGELDDAYANFIAQLKDVGADGLLAQDDQQISRDVSQTRDQWDARTGVDTSWNKV